jgi:cellulose synthase/poly-beta-1,6-N-acetylglucosamine synthase-like glycosyltransferase
VYGARVIIAATALTLAALPVVLAAGYLFLLAVVAKRLPALDRDPPSVRFDVIVPAHDEPAIATTVANLLAVDYPPEMRRVIVVADNCTDDTARRAAAAGAVVLERVDAERRGKGYALAHAFEHSLAEGRAGAVVVVDADTVVSKNLLSAFAGRFARGAVAVQAEYAVSNPTASWRTRLMVIALALFHTLRSLARERLELSAGLRGNGMAFSVDVLREVPHEAFSVVEDLEYGIRLGQAGHRVHYAAEAHVYGEMVSSEKASRSQRQRWEGGRLRMAKEHGPRLLADGLAKRSGLLLDLAMDVLVPPLTYVVAAAFAGSAAALALGFAHPSDRFAAIPWLASLAFVGVYVLRGWSLSGVGARGLLDLAWAPVYMVWKIGLALTGTRRNGAWVRTTREAEASRGRVS